MPRKKEEVGGLKRKLEDEQPDHKTKTTDVNTSQCDASPDGAMNDISRHTEQSHRQTGTRSDVVPLHKGVNPLQDIIKGKHILNISFHSI